jgi:hypothetical protein
LAVIVFVPCISHAIAKAGTVTSRQMSKRRLRITDDRFFGMSPPRLIYTPANLYREAIDILPP